MRDGTDRLRHAIAQVLRDVCRALLTAGDESAKHVGTNLACLNEFSSDCTHVAGSPTSCNEASQLKKDVHVNCDVMMVTAFRNHTGLPKH